MKRSGWIFITALTLVSTAVVLTRCRWVNTRPVQNSSGRASEGHVHVKGHDAFSSEAALRWRRCQPAHWRGWLLQR